MLLSDLTPGKSATVDRFTEGGLPEPAAARLRAVGFIPGERVTLLFRRRGLYAVLLGQTRLCLDRSYASQILVAPLAAPADAGDRPIGLPGGIFCTDSRLTPFSGTVRAALVGVPNCGKTTLFNRLTHSHYATGNRVGVTVALREATLGYTEPSGSRATLELIDLPGLYSLRPTSPEEAVSTDYLRRTPPDLIVHVLNATDLRASFRLTAELLTLGIPMLCVCNLSDAAAAEGIRIDCGALSRMSGVPFVLASAVKRRGMDALLRALDAPLRAYPRACDRGALLSCCTIPASRSRRADRVDAILCNPRVGLPLLCLCAAGLLWLAFGCAGRLSEGVAAGFLRLAALLRRVMPADGGGAFARDLLCDGVLPGVGGILSFLPQMTVLFFALSMLEACGYETRAAVAADPFLRRAGLGGRSAAPLLLGFGCTVPAVLACDALGVGARRRTASLLPYISCGARLSAYGFFLRAFFGRGESIGVFLLCLLGVLCFWCIVAVVGKRRGPAEPPMLCELPAWRLPPPGILLRESAHRVGDFLFRAGSLIFLSSVVVWLLGRLDPQLHLCSTPDASLLAALGKCLSPLLAPIGLGDWRAAVALVCGLTAKENVGSTAAILYGAGLASAFSLPSALAFLGFLALYPPCMASFAALRRCCGTRPALRAVGLQCLVAYATAAMIYYSARCFV